MLGTAIVPVAGSVLDATPRLGLVDGSGREGRRVIRHWSQAVYRVRLRTKFFSL